MRYDHLVAHMAHRRLAALLVIAAGAAAAAFEPAPGLDAMAEAIRIGQSRVEAARVRYHRPYHVEVARPPVDFIEIVTPFRRVVLAAEARASQADRRFGQQDASAVLRDQGGRLLVVVELTFHPLNVYVGVPPYVVALAQPSARLRVEAAAVQRIPRFGPRLAGGQLPSLTAPVLPSTGQPVLGGTLIAGFDARRLEAAGAYDVVIEENGKELARSTVNLASLR